MSEIYATLEQGTTEWLARILEPNKTPYCFVPSGKYHGIAMSLKSMLCKAVQDTYSNVVFVSEAKFNQLVKQAEGRVLTIPDEYPPLQFQFGQQVYVVASNGRVYDAITGIRLDEREEANMPTVYIWEYRVFNAWYNADELSLDPPAEQVAPMVVSIGEAMQEDGLFLPEDKDLP